MVTVRKALVFIEDDGSIMLGDVVEFEGLPWLVLEWTAFPTLRVQKPAKMLCLDGLIANNPPAEAYGADLALARPLPMAVLYGRQQDHSLRFLSGVNLSVELPPEAQN